MSTDVRRRVCNTQKRHPAHVNAVRRKGGETVYYFHPHRGTALAGKSRRLPGTPGDPVFWEAYEEFLVEYDVEHIPLDDRGHEDAALMPSLTGLHARSMARAAEKGVPHELALTDIVDMYWQQKRCCAVSGLAFRSHMTGATALSRAFAPSLDRVDNSKGYTTDNTRLVVRIANFAMGIWGEGDLVILAKSIAAKHSPPSTRQSSMERLMLGHRVRVVRENAEPVEGVLHKHDATGVIIQRITHIPENDKRVFIPMSRIVELEDLGRL